MWFQLHLQSALLPTELHGKPYIFIRSEAHAGHYPCLRYFNIFAHSDIANLAPSVRSVKYPHSCGSFGFHYLPPFPRPYTTTYPLCRVTYLVGRSGFGNYLVAFGCTYGLNTVFSTPSACRSLSLPFRFDTRTGLRPGCCTSSVISTNDAAYLPGLHAARPSAFVEGGGVGPPAHPKYFGESPLLWSDAVAIISAMCEAINHPLIPILPVCANYSGFYLPNMSILIALCFRNQRASQRAG